MWVNLQNFGFVKRGLTIVTLNDSKISVLEHLRTATTVMSVNLKATTVMSVNSKMLDS
jgi:hypothetical protein